MFLISGCENKAFSTSRNYDKTHLTSCKWKYDMNELKRTGRTFKPLMYFFSLSSQEVYLNVLGKAAEPHPKRSFQFKGDTDCRFSYTNPIVYLNMANLPCVFLEVKAIFFLLSPS